MTFEEYVKVINQVFEENQHAKDWEVISSDSDGHPLVSKKNLVPAFTFIPEQNGWHYRKPFVIVPWF